MARENVELIAHLMRRAGFGATRDEIETYVANGYEATVDQLLDPGEPDWMGDFMVRRFDHEASGMINHRGGARSWIYRMITTTAPLQEKMTLFWHSIFATGVPKVINGRVLFDQIGMFRRCGMGNFKELLLALSKDPAMIVWLDNQDNHDGAINENWGRELLELFSIKVCMLSNNEVGRGRQRS